MQSPETFAPQASPGLVVVVDDDRDLRDAVAEILKDAGYGVACLPNGSAALSYLCMNPVPAVVLVDLLMPGLNAWELLAQMRRRPLLAKVPVIAMTGSGPQWGAPVPEELVIRKPIDSLRLLDLVRTVTAPALMPELTAPWPQVDAPKSGF